MKIELGAVCVLERSIPAIQVVADLFGETALGAIDKLPAEAAVAVCGKGLNSSSARVSWQGHDYIVFEQDLIGTRR